MVIIFIIYEVIVDFTGCLIVMDTTLRESGSDRL